jgi:hypothetical protein
VLDWWQDGLGHRTDGHDRIKDGWFIHDGDADPPDDLGDDIIVRLGAGGGAAYAPYQLPRHTTRTASSALLYYLLSTWNPYQVVLMQHELDDRALDERLDWLDLTHTRYSVIWEQTDGVARETRHSLTSSAYQALFDTLVAQGYRLVQVSGYAVDGQERYAAIWELREGPPWQARHGLTATEFHQTSDQLAGEGYVPALVSGYHTGW